jgi:DNA adenine methylase
MRSLSPFRYPGAKARLAPQLLSVLSPQISRSGSYAEPFVGGGSIVLSVAEKHPRARIHLNDKDFRIASFWRVVVGSVDNFDWLLHALREPPTIARFRELSEPTHDTLTAAYAALFLNRCSFSGIIGSGPIGGWEQRGTYKLGCRYNYKALSTSLVKCREMLFGRTIVSCADAVSVIGGPATHYIDPPYFHRGKELYSAEVDHIRLASHLRAFTMPWVLSYDHCPEIRSLYAWANISELSVRYCVKNKWSNRKELLICPPWFTKVLSV